MPANVETMFSVRETPWHGLGRIIMDAPASREALELAGLNWQVESRNIYSGTGAMIPGYRANVRSTDDAVLGVVSDRYRIVQNEEAFQFTDDLLGEGVTYETAGSLQGGKKVWMLARLPRKYLIAGDQVVPYLVIFNSHDGSSGVKVAMTPIRVVCQNTLNLALNLLGCYVHDMRLQFLEFFGRFYKEGGKSYRPLSVETQYVEVMKEDN